MLKSVTLKTNPSSLEKYLEFTWNIDSDKLNTENPIQIPVKDLAHLYNSGKGIKIIDDLIIEIDDDLVITHNDFDKLSTDVDKLSTDVDNLSTNVNDLSTNVNDLSTNVDNLSTNVNDLSTNVNDLSTDVNNLSIEVKNNFKTYWSSLLKDNPDLTVFTNSEIQPEDIDTNDIAKAL